MKTYFILIVLLVTVYFSGCSDKSTNPVDNSKYLMPLSIGNQWVHLVKTYNPDSTVFSQYYDTTRIIDDSIRINVRWFSKISKTELGLIANLDSGLCALSLNEDTVNYALLTLKFPGKVGDFFTIFKDTIYITSISSVVKLDIGTFNCYCYYQHQKQSDGYESEDFIYYSPGVGLVKKVSRVGIDNQPMFLLNTTELVSYIIK